MQATDFLLSAAYELEISGGDFVAGHSDEQHIALIHLTAQGEWRENPLTGLNLRQHQSGPMDAARQAMLQREATIQLERDGYKVATYLITAAAELSIDAFRP
jgi:hypothetical protein